MLHKKNAPTVHLVLELNLTRSNLQELEHTQCKFIVKNLKKNIYTDFVQFVVNFEAR